MINELAKRVIRARENREEALNIVGDFEPLIKKCIKMYIRDPMNCDDAMQEGRIAVLGCIENYDLSSPTPFEAYVKMGVIYCIRSFGAKHREHVSLDENTTEEGGSLHDLIDSGVDLEGDEIRREDLRSLRVALDMLPEEDRRMIEEFYFKKKSMREMSRGKRCHYMTTVRRKERALERLRELMHTL